MATVEQIAAAHHRRQTALGRRAADEAGRLWRQVDPGAIAASWSQLAVRLFVVTSSAQAIAAASSGVYVDDALEAQGVTAEAAGRVRVDGFAGIASDGRELASLLRQPAITALTAIGVGVKPARALTAGRVHLDMIVRTQVADAGRVADGVAIVARPQVSGYVRMLSPPSCSRCVILAGRRYGAMTGFQRHPRCLPAGVVTSGPSVDAATRRWYQGEMVVLATASGQQLPITGNHPVLTDFGWLPANLVQEGDHVVRSRFSQGAAPLVVPNEQQVPSRVEDLWRSDRMGALFKVPTAAEDFHGDGGYGQVDVVFANSFLRNWCQSAVDQPLGEIPLSLRAVASGGFDAGRASDELLIGLGDAAYGVVSGGRLVGAILGGHLRGANLPGCGHATDFDAAGRQAVSHGIAGDAVAAAEAVLAFTSAVRGHQVVDGQHTLSPRWDPPEGSFTMENRVAYAAQGQDLLFRLSGQVELDRVVKVSRVGWSGHVYNLSSVEGWYSANGLIVSNCDCRHIPAAEDNADDLRTDPRRTFQAMDEAEQDRVFTKDGAKAIRDGADPAQVVNASRGVFVAGGRKLTTTAGAGRRPRLTPEQIYREADGSRDEAVRLLRLHRYLT